MTDALVLPRPPRAIVLDANRLSPNEVIY